MKSLKKINKGIILSILVLVILIIYNVRIEMLRNLEKQNIENACIKYVEFANKYCILDLINTTNTTNAINFKSISDEEYSKYLEYMKMDLKNVFVSDEELLNSQYENLKLELNRKRIKNIFLKNIDRNVIGIDSYIFIGNKVNVVLNTNSNIKYFIGTNKDNLQEQNKTLTGSINNLELIKENGVWKVSNAYMADVLVSKEENEY